MSDTHTPGPWEFMHGPKGDPDFDDCEFLIAEAGERGEVVGTIVGPVHRGTPAANARLIAAAPDLLAACKRLLEFAVAWQPLSVGDIADVKRAVEKAEG